jgi:uncharacterized protein YjgD (DUF1641 family)
MAQPIQYTPKPTRTEPTAQEELQRLLQTCHEHGLLRFANDVIAANTKIASVIVEGLENKSVLNAIQNLSIVAMALSTIPPEQLYRILFAAKDAALALSESPEHTPTRHDAPGLTGAYRMLHDDDLWHALTPVVTALKVFASGMQANTNIENPISAFSGKTGSPS